MPMKRNVWFTHALVLFLLSGAVSYFLYAYKPRNYSIAGLLLNFAANIAIWFLLLSVPYSLIMLLISLFRQKKAPGAAR
jgi:hypothetical protein